MVMLSSNGVTDTVIYILLFFWQKWPYKVDRPCHYTSTCLQSQYKHIKIRHLFFCALIHNVYGFYFLFGRISFQQFEQLAIVCAVQCQPSNCVRMERRSQLEAPVCFRFVLVDLRCSKVILSSLLDPKLFVPVGLIHGGTKSNIQQVDCIQIFQWLIDLFFQLNTRSERSSPARFKVYPQLESCGSSPARFSCPYNLYKKLYAHFQKVLTQVFLILFSGSMELDYEM